MKAIYIVLTRTNSILSRLIRRYNGDKYTHAALAFDADLVEMFSFGRKYRHFPFYGVFRSESLKTGFLGQHRNLPGAILKIEVTEEQFTAFKRLMGHFIANSHLYRYSVRGLVKSIYGEPTKYEYRFFCSEFVYYVLHKCNIVDFGKERGHIRPQDFYENLNIIFEGDLKAKRGITTNAP